MLRHLEVGVAHLSRPSLRQITDDDDLLGRCEWPDDLTNLEDKFLGKTSFIIRIVSKLAAALRQIQHA